MPKRNERKWAGWQLEGWGEQSDHDGMHLALKIITAFSHSYSSCVWPHPSECRASPCIIHNACQCWFWLLHGWKTASWRDSGEWSYDGESRRLMPRISRWRWLRWIFDDFSEHFPATSFKWSSASRRMKLESQLLNKSPRPIRFAASIKRRSISILMNPLIDATFCENLMLKIDPYAPIHRPTIHTEFIRNARISNKGLARISGYLFILTKNESQRNWRKTECRIEIPFA